RSLTTTFAPCAASSSASPRPTPRPAPVTIATFPSSSPTSPTSNSLCLNAPQPKPDSRVRLVRAPGGCQMSVTREEVVGLPTGKATIAIERGPITQFAASVTDTNAVYRNGDAAQAAGFDDIPVPPTYFFSGASFWGAFPENQPADANPERNVTMEVI